MNKHSGSFEENNELEKLERAIYAARNYVVPSDDLRPRTLETARNLTSEVRQVRRIRFAAVAGLLVWCAAAMLTNSANAFRDGLVAPFSDEMQSIAAEFSMKHHESFEWGLVEAFTHYRSLPLMQLDSPPKKPWQE